MRCVFWCPVHELSVLCSNIIWIFTVTQSWRKGLISRQNETKYPFPFSTSLVEYSWEYMVLKGRLLCHRMERKWTTVWCPDSGLADIFSISVSRVVKRSLFKTSYIAIKFCHFDYPVVLAKKEEGHLHLPAVNCVLICFNSSWSYWIGES